jgi:hypothetical protein
MELIRCPRCAKEIPDLSRFCRRCGCSVGWGLAGGISPTWSGLADVGVFAERPVTLAGAGRATTALPSSSVGSAGAPAEWRRPKPISRKRGGGGAGAWVASVVMGFAAFAFFMHVHRMATRPMMAPRPAYRSTQAGPVESAVTPRPPRAPRSFPRPMSSDAVDLRFGPRPPDVPSPDPRAFGGGSVYVRTSAQPARPSWGWQRGGSVPGRVSGPTDEELDAGDDGRRPVRP